MGAVIFVAGFIFVLVIVTAVFDIWQNFKQ